MSVHVKDGLVLKNWLNNVEHYLQHLVRSMSNYRPTELPFFRTINLFITAALHWDGCSGMLAPFHFLLTLGYWFDANWKRLPA